MKILDEKCFFEIMNKILCTKRIKNLNGQIIFKGDIVYCQNKFYVSLALNKDLIPTPKNYVSLHNWIRLLSDLPPIPTKTITIDLVGIHEVEVTSSESCKTVKNSDGTEKEECSKTYYYTHHILFEIAPFTFYSIPELGITASNLIKLSKYGASENKFERRKLQANPYKSFIDYSHNISTDGKMSIYRDRIIIDAEPEKLKYLSKTREIESTTKFYKYSVGKYTGQIIVKNVEVILL